MKLTKDRIAIPLNLDEEKVKSAKLWEELKREASEFVEWLGEILWGDYDPLDIALIDQHEDLEELRYSVDIFTDTHSYYFSVKPPNEEDADGYLGGQAGTRKSRAGEEHTRGNDLADGPYSKETFDKIVNDIVAFELVELGAGDRSDAIASRIIAREITEVTLEVGDEVTYLPGFSGNKPAKRAKVQHITKVSRDKEDESVDSLPSVDLDDNVQIDLDNGTWAWGSQIEEVHKSS